MEFNIEPDIVYLLTGSASFMHRKAQTDVNISDATLPEIQALILHLGGNLSLLPPMQIEGEIIKGCLVYSLQKGGLNITATFTFQTLLAFELQQSQLKNGFYTEAGHTVTIADDKYLLL